MITRIILLAALLLASSVAQAQALATIITQRNASDSGIQTRLLIPPYGTHAFMYSDWITRIPKWATFGPNCTVVSSVLNCEGTAAGLVGATPFAKNWLTMEDAAAAQSALSMPTKTSDLTNDSGFITASAVTEVNGQTGAVVLDNVDVGAAATSHSHDAEDITSGVFDEARIPSLPVSRISTLQTILNGKANVGGPISWSDVVGFTGVTGVNGQTGTVSLTNVDVGAAATSHTHPASDVVSGTLDEARIPSLAISKTSGLQTALDGKAALSHNHDGSAITTGSVDINRLPALNIAKTTGLQSALDGKAALSHMHVAADTTSGTFDDARIPTLAISKTTGLQSALDGKAAASHVHPASDVTSGTFDVARVPNIPTSKVTGLDAALLTVGVPSARTFSLATAYQCTVTTRPCILVITLQSTSSISLSGTSNNEGIVTVGSTPGVATGTGTNLAPYKSNLGGGLVVGLSITNQQTNSYTVIMPIGYYIAVRQTVGTGLQIASAFEQPL